MERESVQQYEIRQATVDDAVAARHMHAESWLATYPSEENGVPYAWVKERTDKWLTPENLETSKGYVEKAIHDPTQFYRVANNGDKVVGFIHIATNEDATKELEAIYTDPETFGTGLGQQLMDQALEWIDLSDTTLTVASYNERAIRFYKKNGFEIMLGTEHMYADKIPVVRMIRKGKNHE